jgi:F420-dependent oxidoreductase-like protein
VRLALMIEGQEGVSWEQWLALARACEEHGVETMFRSDHYLSQGDRAANQALDAWTTLAGLAAATTELRLGTLVSPATFRLPSVLANAAATVDQISGGRVELGMGAGWMEPEHEAFGFPFPPLAERLERFAEQLEIVHRLWTEETVDFQGEHYRLVDAPGLPKPVQQPHPPLLVGGSAGRGTAVPAARWADEYNTIFCPPEEFARRRERVREACEREGRDPDSIRVSLMTGYVLGEERARRLYGRRERSDDYETWLAGYRESALVGTADEIVARLREYDQAGCERVMLQHLLHDDLEPVAAIGRELAPAVA